MLPCSGRAGAPSFTSGPSQLQESFLGDLGSGPEPQVSLRWFPQLQQEKGSCCLPG